MRISVSDLDVYRKYMDEDEDISLADVLAQLRREAPRPWYMDAGNAFHKILERSHVGEVTRAEIDGYRFRFALDARIALPEIREMKGELVVQTSVGPVTLVGKVDGFDHAVHDYKLTGYFNPEKYLWSYQWRCYLLMFSAWKFAYDVFTYKEGDSDGGARELIVNDYHELALYSYPAMEADVLRAVDEFARFVAQYMPEKLEASANWQSEPRLISATTKLAA